MENTMRPILAMEPIDFSFLKSKIRLQSKSPATQSQSPDLVQEVFKFAFKVGAKVALAAVEVESENRLKEWKRRRDINVNDVIEILLLRALHQGIERLDESLDN